jgi:hypothetical protein
MRVVRAGAGRRVHGDQGQDLQQVVLDHVAQRADRDFGKLPVPSMQPAPVVRAALRALGRRPLIIPGAVNKASDFAGK